MALAEEEKGRRQKRGEIERLRAYYRECITFVQNVHAHIMSMEAQLKEGAPSPSSSSSSGSSKERVYGCASAYPGDQHPKLPVQGPPWTTGTQGLRWTAQ